MTTRGGAALVVRPFLPPDLPDVLDLCAEHAAYERSGFDRAGCAAGLGDALSAAVPRLLCRVAEADGIVGYATATIDFSTWRAREFLHMDCLYVRAAQRGAGIGARLLAALRDEACARGIDEMQWQTPDWNAGAARFYRRLGAAEAHRLRYRLPVG